MLPFFFSLPFPVSVLGQMFYCAIQLNCLLYLIKQIGLCSSFWTDVFLSSVLWLSYTLPSLMIFSVFLGVCAVIMVWSSAFTGS